MREEEERRGKDGHEHVEGREDRERRDRDREEESKEAKNKENEEGASSPLYMSGTAGYCQATVGRSLDEMSTVEMHHGNVAQLIRVHP